MPEICARSSTSTDAHQQSTWLPRRPRSAPIARRLLREFLDGQPAAGEHHAEVGGLLVSELVANAVEHARTPPGRLILVRFSFTVAELRIEVHDAGDALPPVRAAAGPPDPVAEAGRGLFLVRRLSSRWGCHPRPGGIGKAVWCTVTDTEGSTAA